MKLVSLLTTIALLLSGCSTSPPANQSANLKDTLIALEKADIAAWKAKDTNFPAGYLADTFIGYTPSGKLDKAAATKAYASHNCELKSYFLSGAALTQLDPNIALLTYKKSLDGVCAGLKLPAESSAANVFIRQANQWRSTFFAESPIVDPKSIAPSKVTPQPINTQPNLDPETQLLFIAEKAIWQAWGNQDRARLDSLTTSQISFINIFGTMFPAKADALKDWTSHGCQVKSTAVNNPVATLLSPTVAILNFDGAADGTCFGQKIGPIRGTSIYVKNNNQWTWTFGINIPAKD